MTNTTSSVRLVAMSAICAAALLTAGCSKPPSAGCAHPQASTSVSIAHFVFAPGCIAVAPDATLTVTNNDSIPHTFTVQGTKTDVSIEAGKAASVPLSGLAPGTYVVICRYHPQMVQSLRVG